MINMETTADMMEWSGKAKEEEKENEDKWAHMRNVFKQTQKSSRSINLNDEAMIKR